MVHGLPAWTYTSSRFFELECKRIFRPSWQVVCHVSDIPEAGDFFTFEFLNAPLFVVRHQDGEVRGFYNVCRHRASRLLDGTADTPRGHCASSLIRCPYHAWTYSANGDLVAVPREKAYRGLDKAEWGLNPVAVEIWNGFVFVSLEPDGATSVAEMMAPFNDELRNYRLPDLQPLGRVTSRPRPVNWKTVTDNYVDGLHIAVAHSGLKNIAARSYRLETSEHVSKMSADLELIGRGGWSERAYLQTLPEVDHLPDERQQHWTYYMLWPNIAFDVYPDQVDFMQMLPVGPEQTLIREISYALPDDRREMRLARYLNWRINRVVNEEDRHLVERVQQGMRSGAFERGPLSDEEICLRHFADKLRRLIPEATRSSESDTK